MNLKRKLKLYNLKLINQFTVLKNKRKFSKKIAIVSTNNLKNKLIEDLYIKHALNKKNIEVNIIGYEDSEINYNDYDMVIIRSVWGYQDNLDTFKSFLDKLSNSNINVHNSISVITNNYDKEKQYKLFIDNDIPCIPTKFSFFEELKKNNDEKDLIIKPTISASGNNTIMYKDLDKINLNCRVMVQPFIQGINEGEMSLIYFGNEFSHAIKRYPGILNEKKSLKYIEKVDEEIINLGNKIVKLYANNLFLRIDIIKDNNNYLVLETEALDPSLFFGIISNKKIRNQKIDLFTKNILDKLK